jgi:hypothetical protein
LVCRNATLGIPERREEVTHAENEGIAQYTFASSANLRSQVTCDLLTPQGFSSANGVFGPFKPSASDGISECLPNTNAKSNCSLSSSSLLDEYSVLPKRSAIADPLACSASETATTSMPVFLEWVEVKRDVPMARLEQRDFHTPFSPIHRKIGSFLKN